MKTRKEWEIRMQRADVLHFKSVDHKFCCSEHFRLTDFKVGQTEEANIQWKKFYKTLIRRCL